MYSCFRLVFKIYVGCILDKKDKLYLCVYITINQEHNIPSFVIMNNCLACYPCLI